MGSATIKVIKKSSEAAHSMTNPEEKKTQSFSKKAIHNIEVNIKDWIQELKSRKNDELIQAHTLLSGF
jgi:hypothetical protein